jgi:hypothetical protein
VKFSAHVPLKSSAASFLVKAGALMLYAEAAHLVIGAELSNVTA